ncbi:nicotinate-nucleotide--dimethylbenzimidazole phosphoribosyltransferase [Aneurinibacillus terranovensis]|uniref:nicotinate-nucleotide--dimethylbenzimidazole phosphoribosyltransferase n=1 Tax=Aneurinibacillus terranovensis TaxID=278991 RepID=UPI000419BB54|nr:nicotinate-nucleotide--dimethylbenzimidazole phosphoribosyltransferase [Aneurinibacillus terranovensis]
MSQISQSRTLEEIFARIKPLDDDCMKKVGERVNNLTKPPGSLGVLEEMVIRLAGIQGTETPVLDKRAVVVMCGDHGVVEEGVSAFPSEVTGLMMGNFSRGGAAINVFSRLMKADVVVVDVGSKLSELPDGVRAAKVKSGTNNMAHGPAMSREEAAAAIQAGIRIVDELAARGHRAVALGDMGIGNTTPSAAIIAAVTGRPTEELTGKGTGLNEEKRRAKVQIIDRCLQVNGITDDWRTKWDGMDVLARVGGLEIAGLTGVVIGAAANKMAVVVDGVIAGAAALAAYEICPQVKDYLFASHLSEEPAHLAALSHIGLRPCLHLGMRLGEGSGAVLLYPLLDASLGMLYGMATFDDLGL